MATKFYKCPICGNVVVKIEDSGVVPHCCGQEMAEMHPGEIDASHEKHVPTFERVDDCTVIVRVGSEPHPMTSQHHIRFIWLETERGGQLRYLFPGATAAEAEFCNCKDPVVAVFAMCNMHGLWKMEVNEKPRKGCCFKSKC